MGIWIDELEAEGRAAALGRLRRRPELRDALARHHLAVQDGRESDAVLLLLDTRRRDGSPETDPAHKALLQVELLQLRDEVYELRNGQAGIVLGGNPNVERLKQALRKLRRLVGQASDHRLQLVVGAARAREARRNHNDWLALADLRLQARLQGTRLPLSAARAERRRTGRR